MQRTTCVFFSIHRRRPQPTLFPYTTLFRSVDDMGIDGRIYPVGTNPAEVASKGKTDRKSTRLNSSHVSISYAVFCLKKKTRRIEEERHGVHDHMRDQGPRGSRERLGPARHR